MNISNIINYLNTITGITDIVGSRIFWGVPKTEQTLDYMTVNIITEIEPNIAEKKNRIEFRIIGGDTNTTYNTLQAVDTELMTSLRDYTNDGVFKTVISNFVNLYDNKQRKIMIRDILIYYNT